METFKVAKPKPQRKPRRTLVCLVCKSKKLKCDKSRPSCKRCLEGHKLCVYESEAPGSDYSPGSDTVSQPATVSHPGTVSSETSAQSPETYDYAPVPVMDVSRKPSNSLHVGAASDSFLRQPVITPNSSVPTTNPPDAASSGFSLPFDSQSNVMSAPYYNTDTSVSTNTSPQEELKKPAAVLETPVELKMKPERIGNVPNIKMDLWNPRDILVSYGSTTYYDLPLGTHSIAQSDPYLRALCAFLHGDTITELRSRLTSISTNTPGLVKKMNAQTVTPNSDISTLLDNNHHVLKEEAATGEKELHPLKFIEKAIVTWIENSNQQVTNELPLDYFNTTYTIDDTMDPNLLSSLQTLVREIELLMLDKEVIDLLLCKFYEEIYPFYPLFEIKTFETNLIYILMNKGDKRYEFNIYNSNIRKKLETMVQFLLIISITLRSPTLTEEKFHIQQSNAHHTARQLLIYAQKILSLLNGFKFTNENIICCLLYLYIAEFMNPENRDVEVNHDRALNLKCIENLASTLGLFNDPALYPRFTRDPSKTEAFHVFRRKLWIGLQSLKLQLITSNGGANYMDIEYLNLFLGDTPDLISNLSSKLETSSEIDRKIFSIQEDKYHFHILLSRLMASCTMIGHQQNLQEILDNIKTVSDFMHQRFPLSRLSKKTNFKNIMVEPSWRGAKIDIGSVECYETLNINFIGLSSIMLIYNKLIFYFEKECLSEAERLEIYCHKFFLESVNSHLQLTSLMCKFLRGEFDDNIFENQKYAYNKYAVFTLVRIWLSEMTFAVRFSYKREILKQQKLANSNDFFNDQKEEDVQLDTILKFNIAHIKQQMETTVNLASEKLQNPYFGCYQATLMVKYLLYVMDNAGLADVINRFWDRAFNSTEIPEYVLQKLNMKWGLSTKGTYFVSKFLMNPESLQNLNLPLLKQIQYMFEETSFYTHPSLESFEEKASPPGFDNEEMLNQFLESNFDLFLGVINDNLGELPSL
ncbi:Rds1 protein [Maudiozyma humilis]|uniref:Rds1 protein n=1 Tax=Maudiozyma humilis TaxID=51915 RepID=A0AAV5S2M7_MAUHU|nr:Rds1 protein [Kazachstania humilis]